MKAQPSVIIMSFLLLVFTAPVSIAQGTGERPYIQDATIEQQLEFVIDKSSTWEQYRVIREGWMKRLQKNTLDSLAFTRDEIAQRNILIAKKTDSIASLNERISQFHEELDYAVEQRDSIAVLGMLIQKSVFITITWVIIVGLGVLVIILGGLYKRGFVVTRRAEKDLEELKVEYEQFRKSQREKIEQMVVKHHNELKKRKE